jgi:hypothetical protein
MIPIHFTTGTSTPTAVLMGNFTEFWGLVATNAEGAIYFVKIYYQGNTNTIPVVGTAVPNITIPVETAYPGVIFARPVVQQGPMYYAVTKNAADTDATALTSGGDVITLLVE